ncbi:MAG: hypothetical protein EA001_13455 [Oscillatoriales cyanobacterium]|nr:MAG: hypothetical protein EA001_13455 [Oscillatoriales cyanobacterium]
MFFKLLFFPKKIFFWRKEVMMVSDSAHDLPLANQTISSVVIIFLRRNRFRLFLGYGREFWDLAI